VLFGLNVLLSLCGVGVLVIAILFAIGERSPLIGALIELPVIAIPAVMFGVLAYRRFHHRGVLFQALVAIGALQIALISRNFMPAIYGVFALFTQWLLGEFRAAKKPPTAKGAPAQMARVMWQRGAPVDAVRSALARRRMPADEIEKLVYAIASSDPERAVTSRT